MKKQILITGAAKNVGAYVAERLAEAGYEIILHYKTSHIKANQLLDRCREKGYDLEIIQGDFSTQQSVNKFLEDLKCKVQNLYGFIHNVGNFHEGSLLNTSYDLWDSLIQTNLTSAFILLKEIIPLLIAQAGHVICMGFAGLNTNKADTYASVYTLTKQALLFMVKSFAKELAFKKVKINMISPGYLEGSVVIPKSILPMKRVATFDDIFQTVQFLLNQTYITGQNIDVAGGVKL